MLHLISFIFNKVTFVIEETITEIECEWTHLTEFAIMIRKIEIEAVVDDDDDDMSVFAIILIIIVVCLILGLIAVAGWWATKKGKGGSYVVPSGKTGDPDHSQMELFGEQQT